MRLLIWHVDHFRAEPTERGRSKIADTTPTTAEITDGLVIFAAVEKADEPEPLAVAERAAQAINEVGRNLGAKRVLLHSFAHLFVELSTPATARDVLNETQRLLHAEGYEVSQSAFGWFNQLEMQAKGHPLSRVARQV